MTTLADLQAALEAQARDIPPAEDVLARARVPRHPSRRGLLLAAAAVLALAAAVVVVVLRPGPGSTPPADRTSWKTFRTAGFSVRYPSTWHAATYSEVSTMSESIVFFSNQPMSNPCTSTANSTICRGGAVRHLQPGGVSVYWYTSASMLPRGTGSASTTISSSDQCTAIGGTTAINATIPGPTKSATYAMYACVAAPRTSRQVAQVLESLRSMRQ